MKVPIRKGLKINGKSESKTISITIYEESDIVDEIKALISFPSSAAIIVAIKNLVAPTAMKPIS